MRPIHFEILVYLGGIHLISFASDFYVFLHFQIFWRNKHDDVPNVFIEKLIAYMLPSKFYKKMNNMSKVSNHMFLDTYAYVFHGLSSSWFIISGVADKNEPAVFNHQCKNTRENKN